MKNILPFFVFLLLWSCKEEIAKKPDRLIEKSEMINIMHDLALLDAIKYQSPTVLDSNQIRPKQFIYKKYKIDSLQLAQNNLYYASDYKNYKIMFDEVMQRLENDKKKAEKLEKEIAKKEKLLAEKRKKELDLKRKKDSLHSKSNVIHLKKR